MTICTEDASPANDRIPTPSPLLRQTTEIWKKVLQRWGYPFHSSKLDTFQYPADSVSSNRVRSVWIRENMELSAPVFFFWIQFYLQDEHLHYLNYTMYLHHLSLHYLQYMYHNTITLTKLQLVFFFLLQCSFHCLYINCLFVQTLNNNFFCCYVQYVGY
jgi:hypothetical protein